MTGVKRTSDVLLAFKRLRERGVDAFLCMIGDGPEREQLERRAHELGIMKRTLFLGYQEQVAPYYAALDAMILPSGNEGTPVSAIEYVIDLIDLVLVMSVNPGFGGQAFIKSALGKISDIRAMTAGRPIDIEVDGGVSRDNARALIQAGANVLVAGTAIFDGNDPKTYAKRIAAIRKAATTINA